MPDAVSTADAACVWIAANRADGPPHVTPVWFVEVDGALWFSTPRRTAKARLLSADPRVSVAVEGSAARNGAVAEGRAELLDVGGRPDVLTRFAEKYAGWDAADPTPWGERVLVRVEIDRWLLGP